MTVSSTTTNRAVLCNCTGACRPPSQGGQGWCPNAHRHSIPMPVCCLCLAPWDIGHDCTTPRAVDCTRWEDPTVRCPCRPENGGSGVCGCILSGPRVTC